LASGAQWQCIALGTGSPPRWRACQLLPGHVRSARPERIALATARGAQTLECCKRGPLRGRVSDRAGRLRELIEGDIVLRIERRCPFEHGYGLCPTVERRQGAAE